MGSLSTHAILKHVIVSDQGREYVRTWTRRRRHETARKQLAVSIAEDHERFRLWCYGGDQSFCKEIVKMLQDPAMAKEYRVAAL